MWLKPPSFWQQEASIYTRALSPLSCLYQMIGRKRYHGVTPQSINAPVVCVGNITVGGAGKTPVALAIARYFLQEGKAPVFLSRGYGGSMNGPMKVDPSIHSYKEVGDESLLLARVAPTWIAKDRVKGAESAVSKGADVIIMDDGFQNPSLKKDISFLVVDGLFGFGNGKVFPAGPLRESIADAFSRADACVIVGEDQHKIRQRIPSHLPVLSASLLPLQGDDFMGEKVVAFAGIGNPRKFFATVESLGATLLKTCIFPDHYPYKGPEIQALISSAEKKQAIVMTTEKDWLRLPPLLQAKVICLPVSITWQQPEILERLLNNVMKP